jgi:hypothetical protein
MKRLLLIIFAIFLIASPVQGEFFKDIIVTSPTGIWTDSRAYSTLSGAITAIGASEQDLYIAKEEVVTTLVIPANIRLHFLKDGAITNSNTLTINTRNIHADHQIFTGAGAVNFASGTEVRTRWFEDFETAITQTSNDTVTLTVDTVDTLANSAAVGDNVLLRWNTYSPITISAGQTLSNIGDIDASGIRLFIVSGSVAFKTPSPLKEIRADWFGNTLATLDIADNAATTAGKLLVIPPGDWVIDDNLTLSSNLKILPNVDLQIATTKTLTINGTFDVGRYKIFSYTGTSKAVFGSGNIKEVYPEWWGENTIPGTTDMAPMIQAAIDSRAAWGATTGIKYPIISFSSADYLIESALNLTTTYVAGTMQHDCVHLRGTGYGGGGTRIIGNTGNLMIDTCGSIFIKIEDIALSSEVAGLSNPSTVAILQARPAVNPQCQFHTYRNVSIAMHDDAAANGGMGTIGIMNYAGESVTYDTMFVRANLPVVLTCLETHLYTDSVYQPLGLVSGYHSMGSVKFTGHNNLWTLNRRQPAMILHGVVDLLFNGEITSVPAPAVGDGTNDVAFTFGGPYPCVGITINAVVEALGTVFNIECSIEGLNANIVSGNPLNPSAPLIYLIANLGYISESDIKLLLADNIERNLVTASGVTGSYFRNTTIKTTQAKSYAIDTLPGNLVSNSTHKGFVVEAVDGRFDSNTRLANWSAAAIPVPATAGFDGALETQTCFYNVVGDEVTVRFYFRGVSNQTYFRFTLPFAANAVMPAQLSFSVQVIDNGIAKAAPGMIAIPAGSTTADIYIDGVSTVFTAANAKAAVGEIKYYRDPNYPG